MRYAKKTPGGLIYCNKSDADFAVLSVDEYEKLNAENEEKFRSWMTEIQTQSDHYDKQVKRLKATIKEKNEEINALKEKITDEEANECALRDEVKRLENLLENLKRINKERSNADRKISPKKTHPGYVLLTTQQVIEKVGDIVSTEEVVGWKTDMQTPFEATIPFKTVAPEILKDLKDRVLGLYGIDGMCPEDHDESFMTWSSEEGEVLSIIYRKRYQANYRTGYWEISLWHNLPVDVTRLKELISNAKGKGKEDGSTNDSEIANTYKEIASSIANACSWLDDEIGHSEINEDDDYDNFDPVDN